MSDPKQTESQNKETVQERYESVSTNVQTNVQTEVTSTLMTEAQPDLQADKNLEFDNETSEKRIIEAHLADEGQKRENAEDAIRKNSTLSENSYNEEIKDQVSELGNAERYLDHKALSRTFHFSGSSNN